MLCIFLCWAENANNKTDLEQKQINKVYGMKSEILKPDISYNQ